MTHRCTNLVTRQLKFHKGPFSALNKISDWMCQNLLQPNINETTVIVFDDREELKNPQSVRADRSKDSRPGQESGSCQGLRSEL